MEIASVTSSFSPPPPDAPRASADASGLEKASQQFEGILLRQFLSESMKPMLEGGPSGQVYGYMITDALATSLSQAGGLGFSSVLQAQLGGRKP